MTLQVFSSYLRDAPEIADFTWWMVMFEMRNFHFEPNGNRYQAHCA